METNPHRALRPCWPLFWVHHMRWDIRPLNDGNSCCPTHEEPALGCTPGGRRSQSRMRNRSPRPGPATPKPRAPATSHSKRGDHCFLGLQTRVSGFKSLQLTPFSGQTLQLPSAPQRGSLPTPASSPGKFLGFTCNPILPSLTPHCHHGAEANNEGLAGATLLRQLPPSFLTLPCVPQENRAPSDPMACPPPCLPAPLPPCLSSLSPHLSGTPPSQVQTFPSGSVSPAPLTFPTCGMEARIPPCRDCMRIYPTLHRTATDPLRVPCDNVSRAPPPQ